MANENDTSNPWHTEMAQLLSEATEDFSLVLIPFLVELMDDKIPDKVQCLRASALRELQENLAYYKRQGIDSKLLCAIARKKGEMICGISTKTELEQAMRPHPPHYDGSKFIPDKYLLPEEELICWSETSLRAPLNEAGFNRYMELFRQVFPAESAALKL